MGKLYLIILFSFLFIVSDSFAQAPAVKSFNPLKATVGSTITVNGSNFNTNASENIVFFGAVKAVVTAATSSQISVTVPSGATYEPITVINQSLGLSAKSNTPFNVIFPSRKNIIQTDFNMNFGLPTGIDPRSGALTDIDGDGRVDLLFANTVSNNITIYRNTFSTGDLNSQAFAAAVEIPAGISPTSLKTADINGDGKLDLIFLNKEDQVVIVCKNRSVPGSINAESFEPGVSFRTGSSPEEVAIGDLNNDGKPDLAVTDILDNTLSILENKGTISTIAFNAKVDFIAESKPSELEISDLDLDGKADIIVANANASSISVFRNISSGAINNNSMAARFNYSDVSYNGRKFLSIGDMNTDGRPDIIFGVASNDYIAVFRNQAETGVSFSSNFFFKYNMNADWQVTGLEVADVDGDGQCDIITLDNLGHYIKIKRNLINMGPIPYIQPHFANSVGINTGSATGALLVGDLNNDSRPDIIVSHPGKNDLMVFQNSPEPIPDVASFTPMKGEPGTLVTITGSDFNATAGNNIVYFGAVRAVIKTASETQLIVVVPFGASNKRISVLNKENGLTGYAAAVFSITAATALPLAADKFSNTTFDNLPAGALKFADLDGDNKPDMVFTTDTKVSVCRNITPPRGNTPQFAAPVDFAVNYASGLALEDVDGDGKLDIVVLGYPCSVLKNKSTPGNISTTSFSKTDFTGTLTGRSIDIDDCDLDGKPDIAFANTFLNGFHSVMKNNSTETSISISGAVDLYAYYTPTAATWADVNGDKMPDLLVAKNQNSLSLAINKSESVGIINYASLGDGSTGSSSTGPTKGNNIIDLYQGDSYHILSGDLNNDGKTDFLVSSALGPVLNVFLNNINSSTITALSFSRYSLNTGQRYNDMALGDVDSDGKLDIVLAGGTGVLVFKNNIQGNVLDTSSFANGVLIPLAKIPTSVALSDVNADGRTDIIVGYHRGGGLAVLLNNAEDPGIPSITSFNPATAKPGDEVVISGSNFTGVSSVTLGNTPVTSYIVNSATSITAIVGNGANGDVAVANSQGSAGKAGFAFIPSPSITAFSPANAVNGATITITGLNFTGATAVSFGGTAAASFTLESPETIIAVVASGSSGDVSVITPSGAASKSGFVFHGVPVISSFTPLTSASWEKVTILGTNFAEVSDVKFGGVSAFSFTIVSPTVITAIAGPAASGEVSVITSAGTAIKSGYTFVASPVIASFTASATEGAVLTITGENLLNTSSLKFGGIPATSLTIHSATSISAVVPNGASGSISLTTPGGTVSKSGFVFTGPPQILAFSPDTTSHGGSVTIYGTNFTGATQISIGGVQVTSYAVISTSMITAVTGAGAATTSDVVVTTPHGTATKAGFTYTAGIPTITLFSPASTASGDSVTITGTYFAGASAVSFGGIPASSFVVNSDTQVTAIVAAGVSGSVSITTPGGTATKPGFSFVVTIPAPTIASFSPSAAGAGAAVTITGANLTGATSVTFGGTPASSFVVNSATQITAVVVAGTSGTVSVTTAGGTTEKAGFSFIPRPTISSITGSASEGGPVIITGANFTNVSQVTFGNTPAASYTVVSAITINAVVANGTSGIVKVTSPGGTGSYDGFIFVPKPIITVKGSPIFPRGGSVSLTADYGTAFAYVWKRNDQVISGAVNAALLATETGNYTVSLASGTVITNSAAVAVSAVYTLPVTNFKVKSVSESCRSANDGKIQITATEAHDYTASISGHGVTTSYSFNNTLEVPKLRSGTYLVCITVSGEPDYKQCSEINIDEPKDLSVYARVDEFDILKLELSGGTIYKISFNGKLFSTTESNVELALASGGNDIRISTDKECQGVYQRTINRSPAVLIYPNPFENTLSISIPENIGQDLIIEIFTTSGKSVRKDKHITEDELIELNLTSLEAGMYVLKISSRNTESIYKIVKR
jgi:hypothetical protein